MRLDASVLRYLEKSDFAVLRAVETGQHDHDLVPTNHIVKLCKYPRAVTHKILRSLLMNKLVHHEKQSYDGYRLNYLGLDFLALHALQQQGFIKGVGSRLGVGKESDIHFCQSADDKLVCLKLHRLGRISFRNIKKTRDYLRPGQSANWMQLATTAATKEFANMKLLYDNKFSVPKPIGISRHAIVMEYIDGFQLNRVVDMRRPIEILETLYDTIVKLASFGFIHCDFNEFNLMIDNDENIFIIDFPQLVSTSHPNAEMYFDRDVKCVTDYFSKKFRLEIEEYPRFSDLYPCHNETEPQQIIGQ